MDPKYPEALAPPSEKELPEGQWGWCIMQWVALVADGYTVARIGQNCVDSSHYQKLPVLTGCFIASAAFVPSLKSWKANVEKWNLEGLKPPSVEKGMNH
ncbi:hypothetical protein Pint_23302 [Pistacia integerrima]|uniref:Uncharacterized protein n=1 Tax=Pistacia integerrima TaxID=434235 RepID=A0ACC0YG17_9ROSI|nr:hypothetical protein Pint_23302 [Pistacia integerrima]